MSKITSSNRTGNRAPREGPLSPVTLLDELGEVILAERDAIERLDEEELKMLGDRIEQLLRDLGRLLGSGAGVGDRDALLKRLTESRGQREENERLLQEQLGRTGRSIDQAALGLRAVQAYFTRGPKQEVFVKKKC